MKWEDYLTNIDQIKPNTVYVDHYTIVNDNVYIEKGF